MRQFLARQRALLGREHQRIVHGQRGGEVAREFLRRQPARREGEDRPEVGQQRLGDQPRPVPAAGSARRADVHLVGQRVEQGFLHGHGAFGVGDEFHVAAQPPQPRGHVAGVAHAAAQQQELRAGRREREREFVIGAPVRVAEHLVFVDDEQARAASAQQRAALGFERGDDHAGLGAFVDIARADAHVPAGGAPFGELVVGQRAGGHGEDGLTLERGIEQLEDVRLARAGRARGRRHRVPRAGRRPPLLPQIGDAEAGFEGLQGTTRRRKFSLSRTTAAGRPAEREAGRETPAPLTSPDAWPVAERSGDHDRLGRRSRRPGAVAHAIDPVPGTR